MSAFLDNLARVLEEAAPVLPGGGRLAGQRRAALDALLSAGLPGHRDEAWKYTPLRPVERRRFTLAPEPGAPGVPADRLVLPGLQAWRLVFVNGRFAPGLSALEDLPAGVICASLARTAETDRAVLEQALEHDFRGRAEAFGLLTSALLQDGVFLSVPAGVQLPRPLQVVYAGTAAQTPVMSHLRNLIRVHEGASAAIVEQWLGLDEHQNLCNLVGFTALAPGARLDHVRVQADSVRGFVVNRHHVLQQRDSGYNAQTFDLGGKLVRHDLNIRLEQPGAHTRLEGLYVQDGRSHVDNHTRIDHLAPACHSRERFKGVLSGRSRAVFNGKVVVHPGADGTDAHQSNANLLLSDHAEVDTKPELEIYADDVRCSHGATVGQLDADALFYLRSRGIGESTARALLTRGFCLDTVQQVAAGPVRDAVEDLLARRLAELGGATG